MKKLLSIAASAIIIYSCTKNQPIKNNYLVNESASKAEWRGSAPDHFHIGSFKVTGSLIASSKGSISSGDFIIPVSSIQDYDLPDPVKQTLLDDLLSTNFFNVALHPNATFHITKVEAYSGNDTTAIPGANYKVTGDFSLIGQTHPISFPFKVAIAGDSLTAEATFALDRTKWGMNIYSDPAKPLYILPDINMHLSLHTAVKK